MQFALLAAAVATKAGRASCSGYLPRLLLRLSSGFFPFQACLSSGRFSRWANGRKTSVPRWGHLCSSHMSASGAESAAARRLKVAQAAERRAGNAASGSAANGKRKAETGASGTPIQIGFSDSDEDAPSAPLPTAKPAAPGGAVGANNSDDTARCGGPTKRIRRDEAAATSAELGPAKGSAADARGATSAGGTPRSFRLVSWNINCLEDESKLARAHEVCSIILDERSPQLADIILLQEVDADMLTILGARLGGDSKYRCVPSEPPLERNYFTVIFVRVDTVSVLSSEREDFAGSRMGRVLTSASCTFNGKPLLIMTAHLESEKQSSDERKAQFQQALQKLLTFREGPAIFAGDTNLREPEVKSEKLAKEAGDMWKVCGADPQSRFTWDMQKNDTYVFKEGFQPRSRYDRIFLNPEATKGARSYALLGTERLSSPYGCFPSDHFGMDAYFNL